MKTWTDPLPQKIDRDNWRTLFTLVPQEEKDKCTYFTGTPFETNYLNEPACFEDEEGDSRLGSLFFDNSLASLRLWSFLLTEEQRLHRSRKAGNKIIGILKDLGTIPVIAYAAPNVTAFYPDGAWWIPCLMEMSNQLLQIAQADGFGEDICPARAAVAAFHKNSNFPIPDLCIGAVGACCDDFSAIMQRIADLVSRFEWWEMPYSPCEYLGSDGIELTTGGFTSPQLVDFVENELVRITKVISEVAGVEITQDMLAASIKHSNIMRGLLAEIRDLAYGSIPAPLPSLEVQICEMIALHYCSEKHEAIRVLEQVRDTARARVEAGIGVLPATNQRVVWINPVADLRIMNLFEDLGGAVAGSEYLFSHTLAPIRTDLPPLRALAVTILSDPMLAPIEKRARIISREAKRYNAGGVVFSRIPGASHCTFESEIFRKHVVNELELPFLEISVPPLTDSSQGQLETRISAFLEMLSS